jgi:hypothetical protein
LVGHVILRGEPRSIRPVGLRRQTAFGGRLRICDFYLDDGTFFNDMRAAAEKLFEEVRTCPDVAGRMLLRLEASDRGGAIYIAGLPGT